MSEHKELISPMMAAGHRKMLFERDSGVSVSIVADGTFVVRVHVKSENGKGKTFVINTSDIDGALAFVKDALLKRIDALEKVVVLSEESAVEKRRKVRIQDFRDAVMLQKAKLLKGRNVDGSRKTDQ